MMINAEKQREEKQWTEARRKQKKKEKSQERWSIERKNIWSFHKDEIVVYNNNNNNNNNSVSSLVCLPTDLAYNKQALKINK
jgi:hypothetical protein